MPRKEMLGTRFERLLVVGSAGSDGNGNVKWDCFCDCSATTAVR